MRKNNQRLFRIARSILHNDADAEEVVQQSYLAAFRNWAQLRGQESVAPWLNRIVANQALDRLRQRKSDASKLSGLEVQRQSDRSTDTSPEVEAMGAETRALLTRGIERLPGDLRSVLILRDVQGMSGPEVGQTLGIAEGTVRVRLHRARKALREQLGGRFKDQLAHVYPFAGARCDRIVRATLQALHPERPRRILLLIMLVVLASVATLGVYLHG